MNSSESFTRRVTDLQHEHITDIAQLKIIQAQHESRLKILSDNIHGLSEQFKQVKWTVFGAVSFYVLQSFGLIEFLKRLL